jgi:hypothetical protein
MTTGSGGDSLVIPRLSGRRFRGPHGAIADAFFLPQQTKGHERACRRGMQELHG